MISFLLLLHVLLHVLLTYHTTSAITGEAACEEKGYNQNTCNNVGCCNYFENKCHSNVGANECSQTKDIVVPTYASGFTLTAPTWIAGTGDFIRCIKTTRVFGVLLCATQKASSSTTKLNHIANVLAQLLDNNADGIADDIQVVKKMISANHYIWIPKDNADVPSKPTIGNGQKSGIYEAFPNSCDVPSNRGASNTDRSTWMQAIDNTPGTTGCDTNKDASVEELLHSITDAAGILWPSVWGNTKTSTAGAAAYLANGNCGWGYDNTYKKLEGTNPICTGSYAYSDQTCGIGCVIVEGIYWSSVTWMGGLYTNARAIDVENEWLMTVPDASMKTTVNSNRNTNAKTLQEGALELYNLVSDTTSEKHLWLPSIMPNGRYTVNHAANDINCIGAWSSTCSSLCQETYAISQPKSGTGAACSASTGDVRSCTGGDCASGGSGNVNCQGTWSSTCSSLCQETYSISQPKSGTGAACSASVDDVRSCTGGYCPSPINCISEWSTCNANCQKIWSVKTSASHGGNACTPPSATVASCTGGACTSDDTEGTDSDIKKDKGTGKDSTIKTTPSSTNNSVTNDNMKETKNNNSTMIIIVITLIILICCCFGILFIIFIYYTTSWFQKSGEFVSYSSIFLFLTIDTINIYIILHIMNFFVHGTLFFLFFLQNTDTSTFEDTCTTTRPPSNRSSTDIELTDVSWTMHVDPESGEKYYYNEKTGESQWEN